MSRLGFHERVSAKEARSRRASRNRRDLPIEELHRLGPRAVRRMNPAAESPEMEPEGDEDAPIYVLGEAPGETEDRKGRPFIGVSGRFLRRRLPRSGIRFNNVIRTRPPRNRKPEPHEIEAFRPSVIRDIEETQPDAIFGFGAVALNWAMPGLTKLSKSIKVARGRRFPIRIGEHECWFYPMLHPAYILRVRDERDDKVPGKEWERAFRGDIERAVREIELGLEVPYIEPADEEHLLQGLRFPDSVREIERELEWVATRKVAAGDIETQGYRPYTDYARVLTLAFGTYKRTVAFGLDHPSCKWSRTERKRILAAVRNLLVNGPRCIIQNLPFEQEWFAWLFGPEILRQARWHDTLAEAYVLDERVGGHNLDYLARLTLGLPLKSLSPVDVTKLHEEKLPTVLRYNGLDAKYTHRIHQCLWPEVQEEGLRDVYDAQISRVPTLVLAQREGLPISVPRVRKFDKLYLEEMTNWEEQANKLPEVRSYREDHPDFSLANNAGVIEIFRDVLGRTEGETERDGYSADKKVLEEIGDAEPLAPMVLGYRHAAKLHSTYVTRFLPESKNTYLFPDGKVHCRFNLTDTKTGRLSSEDPNNQNWPKHKDRQIRRIVKAPKGWRLLSADYGQIEARVIAMASKDRRYCKMIWDDYDIHLEWAEYVANLWPKIFRKRGSDMPKFRQAIKNELVFPAFFGASSRSIAKSLELPEDVVEEIFDRFWRTFSGVRKWQRKLWTSYERRGYVETLTGRRRRGPISWNMAINSPVQGTASDITVDAMDRLSIFAEEEDAPFLQPLLNNHDAIEFLVPVSEVDYAIETIGTMMVEPQWEWEIVPRAVDVEEGPDWYLMKPVRKYNSKDLVA